ncbi:unnamed protein product [Urochloa decumbens]|uniref:Uncharacterized protein n=1 Tax=Urochloa decumbens TaxID=240449 RepID=A0ABC9ACI7_9POAL
MGQRGTHSAGKKKEVMSRQEQEDRKYFESCIEEMEEGDEKTMPMSKIVKYHDLVDRLWGWDKLLPIGDSVSRSAYSNYLEAYYLKTETPSKSLSSIAAIAETCRVKEEELCKMQMESKMETILQIRKSIVLSCLIHHHASSFIHTENCKVSTLSNAAFWCIAKEADLTLELLRRGARPCDDYLIDQGINIRMCALSLMKYTLNNSVAASAAMSGMSKEAEMMCGWMGENRKLLDFYDDLIPEVLVDSRKVRYRTLDVMVKMLEESVAGGGHNIDEIASTTGGSILDVLNTHNQKIQDGRKNKRKRDKEDVLGKLWGWERLLPLSGEVEWSDYCKYLEKYYNVNAVSFITDVVQIDTTAGSSLAAAVAKRCLKMEEELVSEWKTRVPHNWDCTISFSTIIQSSLIKERALAICSNVDEFSVFSAIAFVCIIEEADLTCELLKHGAEPINDIIEQSSVIRMCALGLVNIKGDQSIASAAAMVGMAKEARRMSDWIKRENKLITFNLSDPHVLEEVRLIRARTLDAMIRILLESYFPSKMQDGALAIE